MPQAPESIQTFFDTLRRVNALSVVDILLIAILIYAALVWLKGASGMSMVKGAAVIVVGGVLLAPFRRTNQALLFGIPTSNEDSPPRFPP